MEAAVRSLNSMAELRRCSFGDVDLDFVLDVNHYTSSELSHPAESNGLPVSGQLLQCMPCDATLVSGDNSNNLQRERVIQVMSAAARVAADNAVSHLQSDIKTHSIRLAGVFNLKRLEQFLDALLYSEQRDLSADSVNTSHANPISASYGGSGMAVFRLKGVVHVAAPVASELSETAVTNYAASTVLHIVQAVHNLFEVTPSSFVVGSSQDTTEGDNLFVLIGKRLDVQQIEMGLRTCLLPQ